MSGEQFQQPMQSGSVSLVDCANHGQPIAGQEDENQKASTNPVKDISIRSVVSPAPNNLWRGVYDADPSAVPSLSPDWAACVVSAGGHRDVSCHFEFSDGVRAVLPLFKSRIPLGPIGFRQSPPAAWGFGGLAATAPLSASHIHAVLDWLSRQPAAMVKIRPNPLEAELWRSAAPEGWVALPRAAHVLDLAGGFEEVFAKRFSARTRNRVRRAEKSGLDVEHGNSDRLIGEFHALLRQSFERWGKRQNEPRFMSRWRGLRRDPQSKFQTIARTVEANFHLWVARIDGKPAAAVLVLQDHEAHWTRAAMDAELVGHTYANYLLQCNAIKFACDAGCRHYHMGESGESKSIAEFKSHFGSELHPYAEYRYEHVPITRIDTAARSLVKRVIGFRDA
jgi:hypothetical protein